MQTYRIETTISKNGTLTISSLRLCAGDKVEVTIRRYKTVLEQSELYPLRGKPVRYDSPFESVAEQSS
jgi:hypothetical protein